MAWEVEYTDQFGEWWNTLSQEEQRVIRATVVVLEQRGPTLGRPLVDRIQGSRYANMKELRPPLGNIRILFAFDPRRTAILLLGGDKTGRWDQWYQEMVPIADRLYAEYLEEIRRGE